MPEWSPELRRLRLLGGGEPRVGSRLLGLNRRGWAVWPTKSRMTRRSPAARWPGAPARAVPPGPTSSRRPVTAPGSPADGTCRVLGTTLLGPVIGGAAGHDRELADGIRTTLSRIKPGRRDLLAPARIIRRVGHAHSRRILRERAVHKHDPAVGVSALVSRRAAVWTAGDCNRSRAPGRARVAPARRPRRGPAQQLPAAPRAWGLPDVPSRCAFTRHDRC